MPNDVEGQSETHSFEQLLRDARSGCVDAIGLLLQNYRDYLLLVANRELDPQVQGKLGASDVVQETLLTAHQNFGQFHGETKPQLLAWLRQIVINDLNQARKKYKGTIKRQVDRERRLQYNSSLDHPLVDNELTPSTNAMMAEKSVLLEKAMAELSEDYQRVLRLCSWQEKSFDEASKLMSRSPDATRKLWYRALLKLEEAMNRTNKID